mgnify:CR=1 FL=1
MSKPITLLSLFLLVFAFVPSASAQDDGPRVVTLGSSSPLVEVRVMIPVGSMHDPVGKEGLAAITANALLEGGFGPEGEVVTKEELARITTPWGGSANPSVTVGKEATTLSMVIPREVLDTYVDTVLEPLLATPRFDDDEVARLVNEARTYLTGALRFTQTEIVGLETLDNYVFEDTPRGHHVRGTVKGLDAITAADVRGFYNAHYGPDDHIVGISIDDGAVTDRILAALAKAGDAAGEAVVPVTPDPAPVPDVEGREALVVKVPDSGATGVHFAHPLPIDRRDADFWPLFVANVQLGTHRDSHGRLYKEIREERGYNYGDYSYVEHFPWRPYALFPPFNHPRTENYFSLWIRPVSSDHAVHLLKAAIHEFEHFVRVGLTDDEVAAAKNKAKVLYLNYAETASRLLAAKVDDAFLGMETGYLEGWLERIDAVTTEEVNVAIREYLRPEDLKILVIAEGHRADEIARQIRADAPVFGKGPADYRLEQVELEDGTMVWQIPENRLETIHRDAVWAHTAIDVAPEDVRVVPVDALFETRAFLEESKLQPDAR